MFFRMVYKSGQIFLPFCHNTRVWQTDGRTDGRTDRILIAIPRLHSMQRGKNVAQQRSTTTLSTSIKSPSVPWFDWPLAHTDQLDIAFTD